MNRQTYRLFTGLRFTTTDWSIETRTGYQRSIVAVELDKKVRTMLNEGAEESFDIVAFRKAVDKPPISKNSIDVCFPKYATTSRKVASRTAGLDQSMFSHVKPFLQAHPELDEVTAWDARSLDAFYEFLIDRVKTDTKREIYLETLRIFFNWLTNEAEVIAKSPFMKCTIPQSNIVTSHTPRKS